MTVIVFDIRGAERRLKEAGMSAKLAETQAEIMSESFVHHADQLVTIDYLDAKFNEFEARLTGRSAARFERIDGQFKLVYWILAVNTAAVLIPVLQSLINIG